MGPSAKPTVHTTKKGISVSNPSDIFRSLLSRLGVAGLARSRAFQGSGAPKVVCGSGASKIASRTALVLATTLVAVAPIALGGGVAQAAVTHEFLPEPSKQFGEDGLSSKIRVMTIDSGDLYIDQDLESPSLKEFDASTGALVKQFPSSPTYPWGLAVGHSTGEPEVYVAGFKERRGQGQVSEGVGEVDVFDAAGALQNTWTGADTPNKEFGGESVASLEAVAVDESGSLSWASGDVYIVDQHDAHEVAAGVEKDVVDVFKPEPAGGEKYVTQLEGSEPGVSFEVSAVAVDQSNDEVLVVDDQGRGPLGGGVVQIFRPSAIPGQYEFVGALKGSPGISSIEGVTVDSGAGTGSGDIYVWGGPGVVDQFNSAGEYVGQLTGAPAGGFSEVRRVAVDPENHDVYVAVPGGIEVFGPDLPLAEAITDVASGVTSSSATLNGTVKLDKGGEAKCRFEWGTTPELGHEAECEPETVTEEGAVAVHARLSGMLSPATTYYYRLQTTNKNGTNAGESSQDREFTTAGPGVHGASVSNVAATSATLEASINPNNGPASAVPGAATSYYFQYSTASTAGCEAAPASCTSVPAPPGEAIEPGESYLTVGRHVQDLSAGTVYHYRVVALSESADELITVDGPDQTFTTQPAGGAFQLPDDRQWELVSPPDKHGAYIYPFTELGFAAQASVGGDAMTFLTSTPTESGPQGYVEVEQVLAARGPNGWVSRDISTPHERATGAAVGKGGEYVAFSEDLSLAVVQPHGFFDSSLSPEASAQTAYLRTNFLNGNVNDPCVESCYRPLVTGKPGYTNVPPGTVFGEECAKQGAVICGPTFTGATPDLSHIALSSEEPLLAGSEPREEYEWTDGRLSPGNHLPGRRVSTSEDGSWSYFMSESVLAAGAVVGEPNMYVSNGGVTKLIAVLSKVDFPDWEGDLRSRTSRVSPDGRWFAFMSQRELTGYNTHDGVSGQPDEEVYLYHAPADLATEAGTLVCASCDPTGARPVGVEYERLRSQGRDRVIGEISWTGDPWIAANVPGWTPYGLQTPIYQSRYLSNGGRLFFDSNDALVPQDVNGTEDVYEYEPAGYTNEEGRVKCTTASATFSDRSGGCVDLISSGQDAEESSFMDASGSGGDVFFMTAARLVPQDYDTAYDVYDAHECTSAAPCFPVPAAVPPPCDTGDSCKPAPTPQPTIFGEPSSETFSGPGNVSAAAPTTSVKAKSLTRAQKLALALMACHSRRGRRRGVCERQARARYGVRKSSRAAKKDRG
jgi:hypothetical protein